MIASPKYASGTSKTAAEFRTNERTTNRAVQCVNPKIHFIPHPLFDRPDAEAWLESLRPPDRPRPDASARSAGSRLPAYFAVLYDVPLLTPDEERYLFCRMNYLKFTADRLRQTSRRTTRSGRSTTADAQLREATELRNRIVRANLRLVVSVARTFATPAQPFEELVGEGHLPLIRAVELFDVSRGYRFSTYATYTLRNRYQRLRKNGQRHGRHFIATESSILEQHANARGPTPERELAARRRGEAVARLLAGLSDRERMVIEMRFGIDADVDSPSFASIGRRLGLSKERVRQVALGAIAKLQESAADTDV